MRSGSLARTLAVYRYGIEAYVAQWGDRRYRVPPLLRELTRRLARGARVLDAGCGPGHDTRYFASRGFDVVGLDAVREFLAWAHAKDRTTLIVQGDIRFPPFGPAVFDAAWAAASLIHLPKREVRRALRALHAVVAPGGLLAATFVHGTRSGILARGWLPGRYISRWTKADLASAVARAGWDIRSLITVSNRERKGRWLNLLAISRP